MRIVHYINQFFAGVGGEEQAGVGPELRHGSVGPGKRLQALIGDEHEIVATVFCGDDYAAGTPDAAHEILSLADDADPELIVAGPAFTSGRYGVACSAVTAAAAERGLKAIASMHADNPGLPEAGAAVVVESGESSRRMKGTLERLAAALQKLAAGEEIGEAEGRISKPRRTNMLAEAPAAERAVELVLARLGGDTERTEITPPEFDRVMPAGAVEDLSEATVALVTEGGLVPAGNPDDLESARSTRWLRYPLDDRDSLPSGEFESVDGGFSTAAADEDPNRMVPLDVARELEQEGAFGRLHTEYLVTTGNGTAVAAAKHFGVEWAVELHKAGVQAAILTAT
jgi:glycine reductase complex component B subunit gamma